jgi:uncharacterized protein YjbJ (UPF0337 family)
MQTHPRNYKRRAELLQVGAPARHTRQSTANYPVDCIPRRTASTYDGFEASTSIIGRRQMNWDQIQGKWKQSMGSVKEKWGKLTEDDLTMINGRKEQLVGKIQERYGIAKEAAEKQVDEFTRAYNSTEKPKVKAKAS